MNRWNGPTYQHSRGRCEQTGARGFGNEGGKITRPLLVPSQVNTTNDDKTLHTHTHTHTHNEKKTKIEKNRHIRQRQKLNKTKRKTTKKHEENDTHVKADYYKLVS